MVSCKGTTSVVPWKAHKHWGFSLWGAFFDRLPALMQPSPAMNDWWLAVDSQPVLEDDRSKPAGHLCHLRPRIAVDFESIHFADCC